MVTQLERVYAEPYRKLDRGQQAAHVLSLLAELIEEIRGMHDYLDFLDGVLEAGFPEHQQFRKFELALMRRHEYWLHRLYTMRRQYQGVYDEYAHSHGEVKIDHVISVVPYFTSLEHLLERYPRDVVIKDFLDG